MHVPPTHVPPPPARFSTDLTPHGLRIVVPARRSWVAVVFLCAWLAGWAFGEVSVLQELLAGRAEGHAPDLFLLAWLLMWTIGGAWVVVTILWQLAGREVVTVDATTLTHRVELLGLGRSRAYAVNEVGDLRAVDVPADASRRHAGWVPPFGAGHGPVAFDHGARTVRLGAALEVAEAKLLVEALAKRLPRRLQ